MNVLELLKKYLSKKEYVFSDEDMEDVFNLFSSAFKRSLTLTEKKECVDALLKEKIIYKYNDKNSFLEIVRKKNKISYKEQEYSNIKQEGNEVKEQTEYPIDSNGKFIVNEVKETMKSTESDGKFNEDEKFERKYSKSSKENEQKMTQSLLQKTSGELKKIYKEETKEDGDKMSNEDLIIQILESSGLGLQSFYHEMDILIRIAIDNYYKAKDKNKFIHSLPRSNVKRYLKEMKENEISKIFNEIKNDPKINAYEHLRNNFIINNVEPSCNCKGKNCKYVKTLLDLPCIKKINPKFKLMAHQMKVVHHMLNNRSLLVAHSVGSGKTLSAVTAIQCVLGNPESKIKNVIICTPKSLMTNMEKEFEAYGTHITPNIKIYSLQTLERLIATRKVKMNSETFVVIDESHIIRTEYAQRKKKKEKTLMARTIVPECRKAGKVLLLSATPIMNRPMDIYLQLMMMNPSTPPISDNAKKKITIDEYRLLLKNYVSYFKCDDIQDYPKQKNHLVEIIMTQQHYNKYNEIEDSILPPEFDIHNFMSKPFLNGLRKAVNAINEEKSPKMMWIINDIIKKDKINPNNKSVIYSYFKDCGIRLIAQKLKEYKKKVGVFTGELSPEEREKIVKDYNNGKINVLLITSAGSFGLDLKGTRNLYELEPYWNENTLEQIEGRTIRYKSHSHLPENERLVDVYRLKLIKPKNIKKIGKKKFHPSVDDMITILYKEKQSIVKDFMKMLKEISI